MAAAAFVAALWTCNLALAAHGELLPETTLARHGLLRSWYVQVELDGSHSRLVHIALCDGVLYAQTDAAMVHAIDAETGRTLWSRRIGRADRPSTIADANGDRVALTNGMRLYVLNRHTGERIFEADVKDAPGAGPALSSQHVYVPMVSGMLVAYPLRLATATAAKDKKEQTPEQMAKAEAERLRNGPEIQQNTPPFLCRSYGRAMIQPLVTRDNAGGEYVAWPTDRGCVNLARIDQEASRPVLALKYRLETGSKIVGRPGYIPPDPKVVGDPGIVVVCSREGLVYAVSEEDGSTVWRFTTAEVIGQPPAVVEDRVYVATDYGGMYCLDAKTGANLWWTPRAAQFVAASKGRVYAIDRLRRLEVLDAASGATLDAIVTADGLSTKLANIDSDRIYLVNDKGLIQCLRESEQTEPLTHGRERKLAAKSPAEPAPAKPAKKESVAPKEQPTPKAATPAKEPKPKAADKPPAARPKQPKKSKAGA